MARNYTNAMLLQLVFAFLSICSNVELVKAFSPVPATTSTNPATATTQLHSTENEHSIQRRTLLSNLLTGISTSAAVTIIPAITLSSPPPAQATLMDKNMSQTKTFKVGENLTPQQAKERFLSAMADVDYLITNYDDISKNGGDAVRRYLGTVGVEKSMYGITKVVKGLREEADDIVEFTEAANEFEAYLYQAEGAAYQSLFVEHSSAKGTPETFLATAKKDVLSMRRYMGELAEQLKL